MARSPSGPDRPVPDPAGVGEVIRGLLSNRRMRLGMRLGRLVRGWDQVVGERLAGESRPVALDDGGLVVAASSPAWAAQVRFLEEQIRRRAGDLLDGEGVRSVKVVVGEVPRSGSRDSGGRNPPAPPTRLL